MLKKALIISGGLLIAASLSIFLSFTFLLYQTLSQPEQFFSTLQAVASTLATDNEVVSGLINDKHFSVQMTKPFQFAIGLMLATLCLSILIGIFSTMMQTGMALIKLGASIDHGITEHRL